MSGSLAIWYLLTHNTAVTAVVPAARIREGEFTSVGQIMPCIEVRRIDRTPRNTLSMRETGRLHRERVQVMPYVKRTDATPSGLGKKGVDALLALILAACPNQMATIAGVKVVAIIPDIVGPDLPDFDAQFDSASQDFFVTWRET